MKTMKKFASLLLALAMIFALATTAFADGTNSITVNNAVNNEKYEIFRMLDLTVDNVDNPTAYSYTVNAEWENFFKNGEGAGYVTISDDRYVTWNDQDADMIVFGQKAADYAKNHSLEGKEVTASNNKAEFSSLENGYYLITSTLGTKVIVGSTPTNNDITIEEKNPEDTIKKEVKEDSTGTFGESNDAQVGDTVEFKSTATLHPYTTNVKIHDTMTDGLTLNTDSIDVDNLTENTDYTVAFNTDDGCDFEITFTETYLAGLTTDPTELVITYSAVLNEKAAQTTTGEGENPTTTGALNDQTNTTKITYGDKQSVEKETTTTTHKFSVHKHAAGKTENLAGAVFSLKKGTGDTAVVVNLIKIDDNNYRVAKADEAGEATFTTVANGDIFIWGVDADDDYALEEIAPPAGYNPLTEEQKVEVNANNGLVVDVVNNAGTQLPSTGGMGTTLFYVVGGILVAAAAVLLVTKKRMAN